MTEMASNALDGGLTAPAKKLAGRVAFASLIGTFIEFYDFFIYGSAAALVFPKLFFSNLPPVTASIVSFATLGAAFVTRPIGAAVFGHFGDTVGRKAMLILTVTIISLSTFVIGLLPGYAVIGSAAPIALIVVRLLQGMALGGEWGGATTMMIEYAPPNRRGFYGTFVQLGNVFGLLISTGAFALASSLPEESFLSWGWRIPFLASLLLLFVGVYIRMTIEEPPAFLRLKKEKASKVLPIRAVFARYPKEIFLAMGLRISETVLGYLVISYVLYYGTTHLGMTRTPILMGVMLGAAVGLVTFPLWGLLSDHIGRKAVFLIGSISACLFAFPFFWLLDTGNLGLMYVAIVVAYSGIVGAMYSIEPAYISEMFSTDVRYTGVSVGSQLAGIIGGFTPAIATGLAAWADGSVWPISVMIVVASLTTAICALLAGETRHRDLERPETWKRCPPNASLPASPISKRGLPWLPSRTPRRLPVRTARTRPSPIFSRLRSSATGSR